MVGIMQLSDAERKKTLAQAGRDLDLDPRFAAPDQHSQTIALLTRHVDELRMRMHLVEQQQARRWWHPLRCAYLRWRARV